MLAFQVCVVDELKSCIISYSAKSWETGLLRKLLESGRISGAVLPTCQKLPPCLPPYGKGKEGPLGTYPESSLAEGRGGGGYNSGSTDRSRLQELVAISCRNSCSYRSEDLPRSLS